MQRRAEGEEADFFIKGLVRKIPETFLYVDGIYYKRYLFLKANKSKENRSSHISH